MRNTRSRYASERLRAAFEKLGERPFPDDSANCDASELHAELAEFDGYVVGRIATLLNGGRLSRQELESDEDLKRRLKELATSDSPGAPDAQTYLDYFAKLEDLLAIARSVVG